MASVIVFTADDTVAILIASSLVATLLFLYVTIHLRVLRPAWIGLFRVPGRRVVTVGLGLGLGFGISHGGYLGCWLFQR
ncbi:hypothetical protein [Luteimonas panaciterrae]|uniref:hypothetical protein n=1 Tax=Luteimonas panaciterrae TaxID=363885 RepID=UPI001CFA031B|nr:hypothetical protein [Luteimonas panaciterrae]